MSAEASHTSRRPTRHWVRWLVASLATAVVLLLLAAALIPLAWPVPPLRGTTTPYRLRDRDSRFAVVDGTLVHYKLYGSKNASDTILLIHGFGGSTFTWREVAPVLGGQYKVVVLDLPGAGLTERKLPPSGFAWQSDGPYSVKSQADLAYGLLDQLSVTRVTIVGHSKGAQVAAAMAIESPQRVEALVLDAPSMTGVIPSWITPALRTPQGRSLGPLLIRKLTPGAIVDMLRRSFSDPALVTPYEIAGYSKFLKANDWDKGLWEWVASAQPLDAQAGLGQLAGIPTLVIIPSNDQVVPPATQRATARKIPGAAVIEVAGQGHLYHEEQPSQYVATVAGFLDQVRARAGQ